MPEPARAVDWTIIVVASWNIAGRHPVIKLVVKQVLQPLWESIEGDNENASTNCYSILANVLRWSLRKQRCGNGAFAGRITEQRAINDRLRP